MIRHISLSSWLVLLALALSACVAGDELEPQIGGHTEALRARLCGLAPCLPSHAVRRGKPIDDDAHPGGITSELMNGLAHSDKYWFWINQYSIERVSRAGGMAGKVEARWKLPGGGSTLLPYTIFKFDHLGDGDFYKGLLYVLASSPKDDFTVLAFDEALELVSWGKLTHGAGAYVAINPVDGRLYTAGSKRSLKVYELYNMQPSSTVPDMDKLDGSLGYVGEIPLNYDTNPFNFWDEVWTQGGAFSQNGVFYHVLDHNTWINTRFTGVYVFDVTPFAQEVHASANGVQGPGARQLFVAGDGDLGILPVAYDPQFRIASVPVSRGLELEGVDVVRGADGLMHVYQELLSNEPGSDSLTVYEWTTDENAARNPALIMDVL